MQPRMHRRHHRDVDIFRARAVNGRGGSHFRLRRARIAVEEQRAALQSGQRRDRRLMRLVGGDDRENQVGFDDRLGRARRAVDVMGRIVRAFPRANSGVGGVGFYVVGDDAGFEGGMGPPALQEGLRRLAEADEC